MLQFWNLFSREQVSINGSCGVFLFIALTHSQGPCKNHQHSWCSGGYQEVNHKSDLKSLPRAAWESLHSICLSKSMEITLKEKRKYFFKGFFHVKVRFYEVGMKQPSLVLVCTQTEGANTPLLLGAR